MFTTAYAVPAISGMQFDFSWVPVPTPFEVARGIEKRAAARAARLARRVARKAAELTRAASKKHGLYQVDWLNPGDFATEQLAEHAGQFPIGLSGAFFCEIADRVEQMLKGCATRQKDRKKTRWIGVAWRKVYFKLVTAREKYGDPELVAVERGDARPECVSLTSDTGADVDPTDLGADTVGDDPLAVRVAEDAADDTSDPGDDWLRRHDPASADSTRTAERRRAEERCVLDAIARSAARCAQLAGTIPASSVVPHDAPRTGHTAHDLYHPPRWTRRGAGASQRGPCGAVVPARNAINGGFSGVATRP